MEPESGVKLGRAGKSGGKKKQVRMCRYRWTLFVQHRVPAVDVFAGAVVLQHRQHRGHQQRAGEAQAQHSLQPQEEKVLQADAPAFAEQPQEEIDQGKGDLSHEEVVVYHTAGAHRQSEQAPAAGCHVLVQGRQQQGEKDNGLVEMVKEDVVNGKAGKGVQHRANQGGVRAFGVAVEVDIACQGGAGEFEDQQRPHEILDPLRGKGNGQPEEGTAQQVKAVRANEVGSQVRQVAPAQVAGADGVVGQTVKGNLLHVKVPVEEKPAPIHHKKGDEHQKRQPQAQEKGLEKIVVSQALRRCFFGGFHKRAYLLYVK